MLADVRAPGEPVDLRAVDADNMHAAFIATTPAINVFPEPGGSVHQDSPRGIDSDPLEDLGMAELACNFDHSNASR